MAGFFSPESKPYKFICRFIDLVKLSLLWLLFSLPVVTIGISTIAVFTVTLRMTEEQEGYVAREFIKAFKNNWKQGIPMSFISLICLWAVYLDFQLFNAAADTGENGLPFLIVGICAAYVFTFSLLYAYPLLARYENTLLNTIRNSFRIGMKYFLRSILLVLIVAFEFVIIFFNYTTIFIGLLVGPAIIMFTISGVAMGIFRDLEKTPGTVTEKNNEDNSK
ncbi:MAG: YesL family protein [Huintestinicola sp.]